MMLVGSSGEPDYKGNAAYWVDRLSTGSTGLLVKCLLVGLCNYSLRNMGNVTTRSGSILCSSDLGVELLDFNIKLFDLGRYNVLLGLLFQWRFIT